MKSKKVKHVNAFRQCLEQSESLMIIINSCAVVIIVIIIIIPMH